MIADLERIFGRRVDLHERPALERSGSPVIRRGVLESLQVVYAA